MLKKKFKILTFIFVSTTIIFADVGTWTKIKKNHGIDGDFVWENSELAFYDEFSFGANVMVIPAEKPYYLRTTIHKKNRWLSVDASHATQCDVVLFDNDNEIISTYRVKTNETHRNFFSDIPSAQLEEVVRVSSKCNYTPKAQYLCAGSEIRCKNDSDKLVIYLDEPFSPEAKEYRTEVKSAICLPEEKAACQPGWEKGFDDKTMMYCEKKNNVR